MAIEGLETRLIRQSLKELNGKTDQLRRLL